MGIKVGDLVRYKSIFTESELIRIYGHQIMKPGLVIDIYYRTLYHISRYEKVRSNQDNEGWIATVLFGDLRKTVSVKRLELFNNN